MRGGIPAAAACTLALAASAGCGGTVGTDAQVSPLRLPSVNHVRSCQAGSARRLVSARFAYAAVARLSIVAYVHPGGRAFVRFGRLNANGVPSVFGVLSSVVDRGCHATWYRVQLPVRPNGAIGYVKARDVRLARVTARLVVDLSARRVTLYRDGRMVLSSTAAVGAPSTPTPTGRYYVNQRLIPENAGGPFGPGAIGISAFSPVLTGWAQGGPVAIHGTNAPWSIGHAVSNGCIRVPNRVLLKLWDAARVGTPVEIRA